MTVIVRALVCGIVISWICAPARIALGEPNCGVAVRASGDPTLVAAINDALRSTGVATDAVGDCNVVEVVVERRGDQVHLTITDPYGRATERTVGDVATAATVVESWTMQEVAAFGEPDLPTSAPTVVTASQPLDVGAPSGVARPWPRAAVGGGLAALTGSDGHTRLGASMRGCAQVGRACIGAALVFATDAHVSEHVDGRDHERWIDARVTAEVPLRVGPVVVSPGVGLGGGWLETTTSFEPHMVESLVHSARAVHASASLSVGRAITSRIYLRGALSGFGGLWSDSPMPGPDVFFTATLGLAMVVP